MEWWLLLALALGGLLVLFALGFPVAFAFLFINIIGVIVFWGTEAGLQQLALSMLESVSSFSLLPIPLFILMGELMFNTKMGHHAIDVLDKLLGNVPGRLAILTVGASTMFATLSGSSMGTTAMMGSLLVPEMERRGYKKSMSLGPILGSGGLAMMIPPSGMAVVLASLAKISIGNLLIAGIVPGLLMAFFYASYILGRCILQPSVAPNYDVTPVPLPEKIKDLFKYVIPLGFIVFLVIGLIFLGIVTPSEAAACGVFGCILLAMIFKALSWKAVKASLLGTIRITVMTLMIIATANAFTQILAYAGATRVLVQLAVGLPLARIVIVIIMMIILLFLGTFMDVMAMMMITLPIYMPVINALGFNPVWFGVLMLLNIEMAFTTPPFGMLLFVMKGVAPPGTTMRDIYLAALPFLACDAVVLGLLLAFPNLTLLLQR
ncbi:TRAP transporter large permease subunit [Thermodesulfobacteriota bacterium]